MAETIVSLSFDDGRKDTYSIAYPIMKKHKITATVHIAAAFIDGSWKTPESWITGKEPMSVENITEMYENGFEISSHGNNHTTDINDFRQSIEKFGKWGIDTENMGFSAPNSRIDGKEKELFVSFLMKNNYSYLRAGRNEKCYSLISKIYYAAYTLFGFQFCYDRFNRFNLNKTVDRYNLNSVVIKKNDKAENIINFIESNSENSNIIFMLHSVLGKDDESFGKDSWCWEKDEFEKLCAYLEKSADNGKLKVKTLKDLVCEK